jgi:hypothetical protein
MKITINNIPHSKQRYETLGDYWIDKEGVLHIVVSEFVDEDSSFVVGIHELIESWLCKKRGISFDGITQFDIDFKGEGEPGDDPKSPYLKEHKFATKIEKMVCKELGIKWVP